MLKRIFIAGAVAVAAFAASANQREAMAEMAYTGGGGCAILGSPSNDFFCNEYYLDNGGSPYYSGTSGDGSGGGPEKLCGPYSKARCGGETTKVVETYTCTQWMVTDIMGNITISATKPSGGGATVKIECSQWVRTVTTTVLANRWNI
jgi:hypothetical protein